VRAALAVALLLALAAAWAWTPLREVLEPGRVSAWLEPHRSAWYALPAVVLAFVLLGFVMVPAMGMVAVCGLAFGPLRGTLYALAGAMASAVAGYAAGRRLGRATLERLLGRTAGRLAARIRNDGTLAVYLIRKIPAPFTLVNLAVGASGIRFLDFVVGTLLGMGPIVAVIGVAAGRIPDLLDDPSAATLLPLAALLLVPLGIALAVDAALKRRRRRSPA
jgi:uncharacterized membrane protein YdjX (TVP38/TMEM64 family)